jgi:hypothetical protein
MRRSAVIRGARWCAFFVAIALPVSASAPSNQYEFFDSSNTTIRDKQTRLEWQRPRQGDVYPAETDFAGAQTACDGMTKRLPTVKELLTIVDEQPHNQYVVDKNEERFIDFNAFQNTPKEAVWTQSPDPTGADRVYTVDFSTGGVVSESTTGTKRLYRCVANY